MKFKIIVPVAIVLLAILTIGAVSASQEIAQDNLTKIDQTVKQAPTADDTLGQPNDEEVLGEGIEESEIKIEANTKAINLSNGNAVFATIKVPKGANGELDISIDNIPGLDKKFTKLSDKKTKNGVTTYTIHMKDFTDYIEPPYPQRGQGFPDFNIME